MQIFLDNIIFSLQPAGGISVYWSALIREIMRQEPAFRCIERPDALSNIQRSTLSLTQTAIIRDALLPLQVARYLPVALPKGAPAVFHSSYYRPALARNAATVITVYDFIYEQHRSGLRRMVHAWQKQRAVQQADCIICISENTRKDLYALYPHIAAERVRVVPLAADSCYRPLGENSSYQKEAVLFVGDRSHYKNFPLAVETVARMPGKTLTIVGGGMLAPEERALLEEKLPGRSCHQQNVSTAALNLLYNSAFCLLYPSSYEGFGIPPLEAMQAGCPVVATRCSSLPEVCGDAALLAETADPAAFCALLHELEQENRRKLLQERGFRQAATFSWERTWRETQDCYQEALAYAARHTGQ